MKKLFMIVTLLSLIPIAGFAQPAINSQLYNVSLVLDKEVTLDSANSAKTDSAFFSTGKLQFDCDSLSFIVSLTGDSATKRTSPYMNVRVMGKMEWLTPDITKSILKWSEYSPDSTAFISKAANVDMLNIYTYAVVRSTSRLYGALNLMINNADATKKKVRIKVWAIKHWRK